ncbi:histidine ammonia-lyase [Staphylococcus gallinarum]|jgi:histidine ammonia-lyase|uniref:histidine ammonia-lyase n=1 Tax=Staphylococcus gallinarum TaxID=1293 RepID=UPI000D1C43A1|nr:histidine ammonia-lyase [Staphylococcus gallinarum]MBU7216724.1 histidine ammonia-lyase [Staphylococcus gallinarum]MCD8828938.1 histidine ammonia-lyase [Staphylococcus gallinarum]MCD8844084.1 histidine ammonia-lyase [Staphylococcus gallinarum]MCD8871631.1 histidine ammonia-lyase [Staphylococcus gallinarum]MCD8899658.1 histidine ammonia-lyase [Staphylococcus gallinarum]
MTLQLTGDTLTISDIKQFLSDEDKVEVTAAAYERVKQSRATVEDIIANKETIYGITTGFGLFSDVRIDEGEYNQLQVNLIRSHACGIGKPFSEEVALVMMLLRLNTLLKGHSGATVDLIEQLIFYINNRIIPVIPQQGSLGASGDLAPLSHLALALIGEGSVYFNGEEVDSRYVLNKLNHQPLQLQAKEGLALINGTQAMTAQGVISYIEAESLAYQSEWIAAFTHQALNGIVDAYNEHVHKVRNFQEQMEVAERMLDWLEGSELTTRQGEIRVQDAYTLRCIPQIHGASFQVLNYVKEKLEFEMNAANDNPLIFDEGDETLVISGGNFHGQPVAFALDFLKLGVSELANVSERRLERLVNPQLNNGLPAFLSPKPGLQSGAMIMQYAAASLVSENKTLAHPASVDSIPSSANQEDHVSMGTIASRHGYQIIENARRVLAIEAIIGLQAVEYKDIDKLSPKTYDKYQTLRHICPSITEDRQFHKDIEAVAQYLRDAAYNE